VSETGRELADQGKPLFLPPLLLPGAPVGEILKERDHPVRPTRAVGNRVGRDLQRDRVGSLAELQLSALFDTRAQAVEQFAGQRSQGMLVRDLVEVVLRIETAEGVEHPPPPLVDQRDAAPGVQADEAARESRDDRPGIQTRLDQRLPRRPVEFALLLHPPAEQAGEDPQQRHRRRVEEDPVAAGAAGDDLGRGGQDGGGAAPGQPLLHSPNENRETEQQAEASGRSSGALHHEGLRCHVEDEGRTPEDRSPARPAAAASVLRRPARHRLADRLQQDAADSHQQIERQRQPALRGSGRLAREQEHDREIEEDPAGPQGLHRARPAGACRRLKRAPRASPGRLVHLPGRMALPLEPGRCGISSGLRQR